MGKTVAPAPNYRNTPEIAAMFGVTTKTVRKWIEDDILHPDKHKAHSIYWVSDDEISRFDGLFGDVLKKNCDAYTKGRLFAERLRALEAQPEPSPEPEQPDVVAEAEETPIPEGIRGISARWSRVSRARADRDSLMNIASAFCERLGIPEDAAIIDAVKHSPAYLSADEAYRSEKAAFNEWFCQDSVIELAVTSLTAA